MTVGYQRHARAALLPAITGTQCTGQWVGPSAGLDGYEKIVSTGMRSQDSPAGSQVKFNLNNN